MSECFVYGIHAVQATLNHPKQRIRSVLIQADKSSPRLNALREQAIARQIPIQILSAHLMKQRFGESAHQGIVLSVDPLPHPTEKELMSMLESDTPRLILVLDMITDPHNLGACLRTANASGVDFVLIPKDKSASPQNPVVSKVACGALDFTPCIAVTNLARTLKCLQEAGVWIYGAAGEASQTLWSMNFSGSIALVMGSEGQGLRRLTREHCDELFSIPMCGNVESLNVSVATGVCLYEVLRQRSGDCQSKS